MTRSQKGMRTFVASQILLMTSAAGMEPLSCSSPYNLTVRDWASTSFSPTMHMTGVFERCALRTALLMRSPAEQAMPEESSN